MLVSRSAVTAFAVAALCRVASGRIVTGSTVLTGEVTEHEIAKFAYRVGRGTYRLWAWVDEDYASRELTAYAYLDDNWEEVLAATTCEEKVKLARWSQPVTFARPGAGKGKAKGWSPPPKAVSWEMKRAISSSIRTHVWYFTLADCSLERFYHEVPDVKYRVELLDGGGHVPMDEQGLKSLHVLNALASFALVGYVARAVVGGSKKSDGAVLNVHLATFTLAWAALFDGLSSICELLHILRYESNGVGSYLFDAWAAYFEAATDSIMALLALCIAAGWTLGANLGDDEKASRSPLARETVPERAASAVAPLAQALRRPLRDRTLGGVSSAAFVLLHVALAQWSRTYDDDFSAFHDFEHPPGRCVVLIRVLLFAVFVPVALRTQACAGSRLRRFYVGWALVGGAWLLSLPLLAVIAGRVPPYARHKVIQGGTAVVQTAALAGFAGLFTGRAARVFHDASTVGDGAQNLDFAGGATASGSAKLRVGPVKLRVD